MLELKNISKTFNAGTVNQKVALNGLNLTMNEGDFVTVIGGNGAGKSTMLNAIAGVFPVDTGKILIDGVVENIEYYGLYIKYYIDVGSQILKAIEKNDGINIYAPGEKVTVAMKPTDVMSYDAQ